MTATMKGLLKGLRYISQIFEASDEEEPEMQIGNPTDVKHVAHIGWDGPSVNSPSWMNEFRSPSESSSAPNDNFTNRRHSEDVQKRDAPELANPSHFSSLEVTSPTPDERKQSRRRHSASGSINSPGRDIINGLKPRRHHESSHGADSSPNNIPSASASPSIPKKSSRKKSKDASVDGSMKSGGGLINEGSSKLGSGSSSKSRLKVRKSSEPKSALSDPRPSLTELDSPTSAFRTLALNEKKNQDLDF
ncbi:Crib domain-containing protein ric7 [Thalictrum thalictroides]|uniref:Crib domain-containing protein ric7 n=1 Tax=Thalictrum thalictroides TaxID=46969 RepID=A0A7J6VHP2_THATH|nr:Crib domain-containing protein ric7 [Thalictrum thalictroides]